MITIEEVKQLLINQWFERTSMYRIEYEKFRRERTRGNSRDEHRTK